MNDRYEPLWMALTVLVGLTVCTAYYLGVVKPNDETRWEIIACMDEAGDIHSREFYKECRDRVLARR